MQPLPGRGQTRPRRPDKRSVLVAESTHSQLLVPEVVGHQDHATVELVHSFRETVNSLNIQVIGLERVRGTIG